jgi:glycosyltransferase involved in cell wall biosynthesis
LKYPKVTIITVCFNSEQTIRETIESVLSQDYPNIEYIIVDGKSNDKTMSIISEYSKKISKVISEPDNGIYQAMNKGINCSTGEIIGILNSDDIYYEKKSVSILINLLLSDGVDAVFSDLLIVSRNDVRKVLRHYDSGSFSVEKFKYGIMPAHPTFFVRKKIYEIVGNYSEKFRIAADYELLIRMLYKSKISYSYFKGITILMRAGGISTKSFRNKIELNREILVACKDNGIDTNWVFLLFKIPKKFLEVITVFFKSK